MYTDIIHYELPATLDQKEFLALTEKVRTDWMQPLHGFVSWTQHRNLKGGYTDIVVWQSQAAAKKAEAEMAHNPHQEAWVACYQNVRSEALESLALQSPN